MAPTKLRALHANHVLHTTWANSLILWSLYFKMHIKTRKTIPQEWWLCWHASNLGLIPGTVYACSQVQPRVSPKHRARNKPKVQLSVNTQKKKNPQNFKNQSVHKMYTITTFSCLEHFLFFLILFHKPQYLQSV